MRPPLALVLVEALDARELLRLEPAIATRIKQLGPIYRIRSDSSSSTLRFDFFFASKTWRGTRSLGHKGG